MAEHSQPTPKNAVVDLPRENKGGQKQSLARSQELLSQDKIYQLLEKGVIYTMEDDLKEAKRMGSSRVALIPEEERANVEVGLHAFKQDKGNIPEQKMEQKAPKPAPLAQEKEPIEIQPKAKEKASVPEPIKPAKEEAKEIKPEEKAPAPQPIQAQKPTVKLEETIEQKKEPVQPPPKINIPQPVQKEAKAEEKKPPLPEQKQPEKPKESLPQESEAVLQEKKHQVQSTEEAEQDISLAEILKHKAEIAKVIAKKNSELLRVLRESTKEELPLQQKRRELASKMEQEEASLEEILKANKILDDHFKGLEEKEAKATDFEEKHLLEEKRWGLEEKKRAGEEKRWGLEEEIEKISLSIGNLEQRLKSLEKSNLSQEEEKQFLAEMKSLLDLAEKKDDLKKKLELKQASGLGLEEAFKQSSSRREELQKQVEQIRQEEEALEKGIKDTQNLESQAKDVKERRKIGQERWQKEQQRKLKEKERWQKEEELKAGEESYGLLKSKFEAVNNALKAAGSKVNENFAKIKGNDFLKKVLPEELLRKNPAEELKELVEKEEKKPPEEPTLTTRQQEETADKVLERLKQNVHKKQVEIKREAERAEEAQEEAEKMKVIERKAALEKDKGDKKLQGPLVKEEILKRLTRVSQAEERQRQEFLDRVSGKIKQSNLAQPAKQEEANLQKELKPLSKKGSQIKKIIIRFLFILIFVLLLGAIAWLAFKFFTKESQPVLQQPEEQLPSNEEQPIPETIPEEVPENEEINLPAEEEQQPIVLATTTISEITLSSSGLEVDRIKLLSFTNKGEIDWLFRQALEEDIGDGSLERIVFASSTSNEALPTKEVLQELEVSLTPQFAEELGMIDLFIYQQKAGKRIVMFSNLFGTSSEKLVDNFSQFEKQAYNNLQPLIVALGQQTPPLSQTFKRSSSQPYFKFMTISKDDFGICYFIDENYFVLTLSYEAMEKILNKLF